MNFSVSSRLRTMRKSAGLSQSQLAFLSGLSQNSISSIERGEYGISLSHALMIARVFGCHVEDIWSLDDERLDDLCSYCDVCYRPECVCCSIGYEGVIMNA